MNFHNTFARFLPVLVLSNRFRIPMLKMQPTGYVLIETLQEGLWMWIGGFIPAYTYRLFLLIDIKPDGIFLLIGSRQAE